MSKIENLVDRDTMYSLVKLHAAVKGTYFIKARKQFTTHLLNGVNGVKCPHIRGEGKRATIFIRGADFIDFYKTITNQK